MSERVTVRRGDLSAVLYLGDCLELLPSIGGVDALVTDPPYGIGADVGQAGRAGTQRGAALAPSKDYGAQNWDSKPLDAHECGLLLAKARHIVIFGGNYFPLPPSRCWLVWDKCNGENRYADCELAWTNADKPVRRLAFRWHGMLRDEPGERVHPTQKPVTVMVWAMEQIGVAAGATVLDPYMGSGTTGIACLRTGRNFIGIEKDPQHFKTAVERIEREAAQLTLL